MTAVINFTVDVDYMERVMITCPDCDFDTTFDWDTATIGALVRAASQHCRTHNDPSFDDGHEIFIPPKATA